MIARTFHDRRGPARRASLLATCLAIGPAACADDDAEPRPRLEILIDDMGIPHVFGATDADVFYGGGYQMARDRLYHMEMMRRLAQGRTAEILGESGVEDDELARTFDWPGWGRKHAEKMAAENAATHALVEAWTDGVNARIEEIEAGEAPLPWGFGPDEHDFLPTRWEVADVLTIATMTGFGNDLSFDKEVFAAIAERLFPDALAAVQYLQPARATYTMTPELAGRTRADVPAEIAAPAVASTGAPASGALASADRKALDRAMRGLKRLRRLRGIGSNNWAVHGRHTDNGRPLIAGDPHLGYDLPGVFYAQHLHSKDQGGTIDAAGFSFAGTPGISVGHTDRVVWTPTTAFLDVMDVWAVQVPDPDHVIVAGATLPILRREEIITVRAPGRAAGEGTDRSLEVLTVEGHGVILPTSLVPLPLGDPGDRLLMNWIGFTASAFPSLLDFNRVASIDEFDVAVDGFGGNFNFVAADADGITYRVGTRVPVRDVAEGRKPWLVLDADDPKTLWTGAVLGPERLPHGRGGDRGFLATANNDPFGHTANGRVDDDPYYYGAFFAPGWRAGRIESELTRLTNAGKVTLADMQALQQDVHSNLRDDLVPLVQAAWTAAAEGDPALAEWAGRDDLPILVDVLASWDGQMDRTSAGAVVLHAFAQMATRAAIGDDISLVFLQAMDLQPVFILKIATLALLGAFPEGESVLQEGRHAIVLKALADTADLLTTRFGGVDPSLYVLGDVKLTSFDGATGRGLDRGTYPTQGGESTVNVSADGTFFDELGGVHDQWVSHWGPIFRHVSTFADDGTPELWFDVPLGNVAEPDSPHFSDMHDAWLDGEYHRMLFARDEIEARTEERYTLLDEVAAGDGG